MALVPIAALIIASGCSGGGGMTASSIIPATSGGSVALGATKSTGNTAQSIDIQLDPGSDTFVFTSTGGNYVFNRTEAGSHYTNAWDGNPGTWTCTGGNTTIGSGKTAVHVDECTDPANVPSVPALSPDNNGWGASGGAFVAFLNKNRCAFWTGGTLPSTSYTQTSNAVAGLVAGNYRFTFGYTVSPTGPVDPQTAWDNTGDDTSTGSNTVTIPGLSGWVAGESVLYQSTKKLTKVSYDLGGTGQGTPAGRVSLTATINDAGGNQLYAFTPVVSIDDSSDFVYSGNAGANTTGTAVGDTNQLFDGYSALAILNNPAHSGAPLNGYARSVNFAPSTPLPTERGTFNTGPFALTVDPNTPTTFSVVFSGSVKGNSIDGTSTGGSQTFTVTNIVHVSANPCDAP